MFFSRHYYLVSKITHYILLNDDLLLFVSKESNITLRDCSWIFHFNVFTFYLIGPAPTEFTDYVYELSTKISTYKICQTLDVDFSKPGTHKFTIGEDNNEFVVEVIRGLSWTVTRGGGEFWVVFRAPMFCLS